MIRASADFTLLAAEDGGLRFAMDTPCRSLLLRTDAGPGIGQVVLGVNISTRSGEPLSAGATFADARFDFWTDLVEVYLRPLQRFDLSYPPSHVIGAGVITSVESAWPA